MKYVAFLRALNVGGRTAKSAEILPVFESAGLVNVSSFLASGNILFETNSGDLDELTQKLESSFHNAFGFMSHIFIRSSGELRTILQHEPFDPQLRAKLPTNCVGFTRRKLPPDSLELLKSLGNDLDYFAVTSTEIYWASKSKQSEASFTLKQLEKSLGLEASFRGMNTIKRLVAKL